MAPDADTIQSQKKTLRSAIRKELAAAGERRLAAGMTAAKTVTSLADWHNACEFLLFVGMESEIATEPLIETAFSTGKPVYLPRIDGKVMEYYAVSADDWRARRLVRHSYGMLEPRPEWPVWSPGHGPTLIICPGMAFDREGNRLGHGGGFYDRFLARVGDDLNPALDRADPVPGITLIGFCYDFQIAETVPTMPADIRVHGVVTDKQWVRAADH